MEIGIIGLPNVGKTSLFNLLTNATAQIGNFPFTTIEPNVGIVIENDLRLAKLGEIFQPEKLTPAHIKFVDIAGLVKGAHKGEGLGNKFLSHIRPLEVLLHVLRDFKSDDVVNVSGMLEEQKGIVETELLIADMEFAERQRKKIVDAARAGQKTASENLKYLEEIIKWLNNSKPLREKIGKSFDFLTAKPIFYVINTTAPYSMLAKDNDVYIDIKLELESLKLPENEREQFLKEYGITESAIGKIISKSKSLLDILTFYTTVGKEVRAWNIKNGLTALEAAAKIHTDMAKGFIRADVYNFTLLEEHKTEKKLHELGLVKSEGRNYKIKDGDVIKIHFR